MAGPRTRRNAGGAPTNNNGTPVLISTVSYASTAAPTQAFASAPASVLGSPGRYMDKNLQKATKMALESFF